MKALIVDDEINSRDHLSNKLAQSGSNIDVAGVVDSASNARQFLSQQAVDLVFLDVEMPGEDGFSFLDSIKKRDFLVVFVTAYDQYSVRAFKANAVDYLVKPVQEKDLLEVEKRLHRKQHLFQKNTAEHQLYQSSLSNLGEKSADRAYPSQLIISDLKGFTIINTQEIVYLEAQNYYTIFHLQSGASVISSYGLSTYTEVLDPEQFVRIHRSTVINLTHLQGCVTETAFYAVMKTGVKLEVSRRRKNDFLSLVRTKALSNGH